MSSEGCVGAAVVVAGLAEIVEEADRIVCPTWGDFDAEGAERLGAGEERH
jgi:hypothetical protein